LPVALTLFIQLVVAVAMTMSNTIHGMGCGLVPQPMPLYLAANADVKHTVNLMTNPASSMSAITSVSQPGRRQ
jgi:uncharacterized membrane protein YfcA